MTAEELFNIGSFVLLVGLAIALILLIVLLWRANRVLYKIDHLQETLGQFVKEVVPAIVNIGTVMSAVEAVMSQISEFKKGEKKK